MLLVEFTVGATKYYISNEYLDIEHYYDPYVASLGQLRVATRQVHGGFAAPTFGQIDILPTLFGPYLPQVSCAIKISVAVTGESNAVVVFEGIAHLNPEIKRDGIVYDLFGPSLTTTVTDAAYAGTLGSVFNAGCIALGLGLDATYARAVSPDVDYQSSGQRLLVDDLSDIAAFFSHRFYISGTTLYLIDCLLDNGPVMALTEFDIFPSSYAYPEPISRFTAKYPAQTDRYILNDIVVQGGGANKAAIAEAEMRVTADGADATLTIGGTAIAKDSTSPNLPVRAVDDNAATYWQSSTAAGTTGMYWGFVFPYVLGGNPVIEYTIAAPPTPAESPVSWNFQGYDHVAGLWRTIKEERTEGDWIAAEVRKFTASQPTWEIVIYGTYRYANDSDLDISPVCHTVRANIETALTDIKTIAERLRVRINKPLTTIPKIGQKITLTDESLHVTATIWARVSALVLDFDNDQCTIEGEGTIS